MLRPNYRADAKWIFGIICLVSVVVACVIFSARSITDRETATGLFTAAVGGFASESMDDEEWRSLQANARANPTGEFSVPGFKTELRGAEIASLSKEEAVALAVAPVAQVNYESGSDAATALLALEEEDGNEFTVGPLSALTRENHGALQPFLVGSLVVAFVSGTLLFAFSRGPGRGGAVFFVVATGTAAFALIWTLIRSAADATSPDDGIFARELASALSGAAGDLSAVFLRIFIMTAILTVLAIIAHFGEAPGRRLWARYRNRHSPDIAAPGDDDAESHDRDEPASPLSGRRTLPTS